MSFFLKRVGLFCLMIIGAALFADFITSKGLQRTQRGHFYTMNALMNQTMDADIVVIGNSRASCSYHPFILDSILTVNSRNLGVSGQPFGVSWLRWKLYRRRNIPPKLLIINIDYAELEIVTNGFEKEQYYPYMSDTLVRPYLDLYGFSWADKHIPMYRYRGDYKTVCIGLTEALHVRHDTKGDSYKGYTNSDSKWDGTRFESVIQAGRIHGACNQEAVSLLKRLLTQVKAEGTEVVFVYAPMYHRLKKSLDESEAMDTYDALSRQFSIPILDYTTMRICSDTLYFKDANHVNEKGAVLFSTALAHDIDSLGIINRKTEGIDY